MRVIWSVLLAAAFITGVASCASTKSAEATSENRIVVLDPGHFHAGLLQMHRIEGMCDTVAVYAPREGQELGGYLYNINYYNNRKRNPTSWVLEKYVGADYLEQMIAERKGNTVVLAGNNQKKTRYIYEAIKAGFNVLADKPMAITTEDFELLEKAYKLAKKRGLILYELMTERYDIYNIVEKELLHNKAVFGELERGTADKPAVYMESVHYFCRISSSGKASERPMWYYDVAQQGEGIADVTTHLIDLVQWSCFPEQSIRYGRDVVLTDATHYPTLITLEEYKQSTRAEGFPDYLQKDIRNGVLEVMANGTLNFEMKGINVGIKVVWDYLTPKGGGNTSTSIKQGTRSRIEIVQNAETGFKKEFFVVKAEGVDAEEFNVAIESAIAELNGEEPYITLTAEGEGRYRLEFSKESKSSHENHFGLVAQSYFRYMEAGEAPAWERENALSKYWITTQGVERAKSKE